MLRRLCAHARTHTGAPIRMCTGACIRIPGHDRRVRLLCGPWVRLDCGGLVKLAFDPKSDRGGGVSPAEHGRSDSRAHRTDQHARRTRALRCGRSLLPTPCYPLPTPGSELPSAHARAHTKARTHHNYSVPPYSCAPLLRCRDVAWRGVAWPHFGVYRCGQSLSMQTVGGLAVRCR